MARTIPTRGDKNFHHLVDVAAKEIERHLEAYGCPITDDEHEEILKEVLEDAIEVICDRLRDSDGG